MKAPSRQAEYNPQIVKEIGKSYQKHIKIPVAAKGESLEGTGSIVFDHKFKRLYVCISERACARTLNNYLKIVNSNCLPGKEYTMVTFKAFDNHKKTSPIYHTNVMMAILEFHVIVNLNSIIDPSMRAYVKKCLSFGREIIDISHKEMGEMCGNMIQVKDDKDQLCLIMSTRALKGLSSSHKKILEAHYKILATDISTIEHIGGGSARCMVAEIF